MKLTKTKIISIALPCGITAYVILAYMSLSPKRIGIKISGGMLRNIVAQWEKDGSPADVVITNYVEFSTDDYFVFTNEIMVAGRSTRPKFGVRSLRLGQDGFLAITEDKQLLWVNRDGTGTRLKD